MQRIVKRVLPALIFMGVIVSMAPAQGVSTPPKPTLEVALTYEGTLSDLISSSKFWMQGAGTQIHGRFYRGWGVVADIAGTHVGNISSTGVELNLVTATFGPRYTWSPAHARYSLYGQGLLGEAFGFNGIFPNSTGAATTASSLAVKTGGGLSVNLARHFGLRAFEVDYLRTQFPNSTNNAQNNLQFATGLVMRL